MITYDQALAAIIAVPQLSLSERVPIAEAFGRVSHEDIALSQDQPPFDRATMDGYAIMLDGERSHFPVIGTVIAGSSFRGVLQAGQALRIMTGVPCPTGATVVAIEATDGGVDEVVVNDTRALIANKNIARQGEDGRAGVVIIPRGNCFGPLTISAAAMAGTREVLVARRIRLAIVTTGDEVDSRVKNVSSLSEFPSAAIHDSNGPFLSAFAAALGATAIRTHARDDGDALRQALSIAGDDSDIVVTSGGVSAGDKDLVVPTAHALGYETVFHHIAMQPGKPVFFARRGNKYLVGLPGNPVSVIATAHLILLPLIAQLCGAVMPSWREYPLAIAWKHSGPRRLFLPARLRHNGIEPVRWNGSGDLLAAASADGLVDLAGASAWEAGAKVRFLPYLGQPPGEPVLSARAIDSRV